MRRLRPDTPASVLVVTGEFPLPSETFVLDQVCGLIDRGFDVQILAMRPALLAKRPPEFNTYHLEHRIHYVTAVETGGNRVLGKCLFGLLKQRHLGIACEVVRVILRHRLTRLTFPDKFQLISYALEIAQQRDPDFVLCHFGIFGDLMVRIRSALGKNWRIGTIFHGYDISSLVESNGRGLYRRLLSSGDVFLPVSDYFATKLRELGAPAAKIKLMRMGIKSGMPLRRLRDLGSPRPFTLVSVGRLVEKKGHQFTLKALARCLSAGVNMRLIICGDGPLAGALQSISEALSLSNHVEFRGVQTREAVIKAMSDEADAFILPSVTASTGDMEGVPVAIEEAMAIGLPVISTYHSGIPEVVINEVTGLLVPEKDVLRLSDAMMSVATSGAKAIEMGFNGRERVQSELTLDLWMDKLADIIDSSNHR